jgi:hypothetical protein
MIFSWVYLIIYLESSRTYLSGTFEEEHGCPTRN